MRIIFTESLIWFLWTALTCLDFLITGLYWVIAKISNNRMMAQKKKNESERPVVVVVGASFAGVKTAQDLTSSGFPYNNKAGLDVVIVDYKDYFEYVPGSLRCFVEPDHFKALSCPLTVLQQQQHPQKEIYARGGPPPPPSSPSSTISTVTGEVVNVDPVHKIVKLEDGNSLAYDYLVLAAGSTYEAAPVIKVAPSDATIGNNNNNNNSNKTALSRQQQWYDAAQELDAAQTVAIVGAGAVGVELAGEILTAYSAKQPKYKRVILVDLAPQILTGFLPSTVDYATTWLKQHGAELCLGSSLKHIGKKSLTFADGKELHVDVVYRCIGAAPAVKFLKKTPLAAALTGPKESVKVNDYFQVVGFEKHQIFCAGDMCYHSGTKELKLGHTAEVNAHLVAANILRMIRNQLHEERQSSVLLDPKLLTYPSGIVGNDVTPVLYNISLGKYDASIGFNSVAFHGSLAAVIKWLIEWTKVAAVQRRPIGILSWKFGDFVTNLLSRTILSTKTKANR